MAMTVNYLTIDGEIVSETRNGVRSDYLPDALGSTIALTNSSQAITDTFSWWPYGQSRSHVGSSTTPFGYGGTLGYYADSVGNRLYVESRILRPLTTAWQTVDRLWPDESAYTYVDSNPCSDVDPSGEAGCQKARPKKPPKSKHPSRKPPRKPRKPKGGHSSPVPPESEEPPKKSDCHNASCDSMCNWRAKAWGINGVAGSFGAECGACCHTQIFKNLDDFRDCLMYCAALSARGSAPSGSNPLLPCKCP